MRGGIVLGVRLRFSTASYNTIDVFRARRQRLYDVIVALSKQHTSGGIVTFAV
jgi:hypothetical protein